jgi:predicted transcriptional regulator
MNFNLYLEDKLAQKLQALSQSTGKSRNALVREAIQLLISQHQRSQWSSKIFDFQGLTDAICFEAYREEFIPPSETEVI